MLFPYLKLFFPTLQLKKNSGQTRDHAEEPDSPLVYLCTDDDLGHVGTSQRRYEISHQINKFHRDDFSLLINLINFLKKLYRSHFLKHLLKVRLLLETFPQTNCKGQDLPHNPKEKNRIRYPPDDTVRRISYHHHDDRCIVEK
jgi:hypothetical protein